MQKKIIIAGPCSVESPEQLELIAQALSPGSVEYLRGGIWKPRTRPGSYEGVGEKGLKWMVDLKTRFGFKLITEVATVAQVEKALSAGIDAVWLGARTTVNPFYVQQIADALKGIDIPVFVKNPINPDLHLWIGALERISKSVNGEVLAIHRGFSSFRKFKYRNQPQWTIPISLMQQFPAMRIICDPSHIAGEREVVHEVAQQAYDLQFDGLMVEIHPNPATAKSDSAQQLTPDAFKSMIDALIIPGLEATSAIASSKIEAMRKRIDDLDEKLIDLLAKRMKLSSSIGEIKSEESISVLQPQRWKWILTRALGLGEKSNVSEEFITALFNVIHEESINRQVEVMKKQNFDSSRR